MRWLIMSIMIIITCLLTIGAGEGVTLPVNKPEMTNNFNKVIPGFYNGKEFYTGGDGEKGFLSMRPYNRMGGFQLPIKLNGGPRGIAPIQVTLYDPNSSVKFATGDILTVPIEERKYIRYLSLYNIPKEDRKRFAQIISFMVNSLGRRRQPYIPLFVGASNETVLRINIKDYVWDREVYENFCKKGSGVRPTPEPYFHAFAQELKKVYKTKTVTKMVTKKVPVKKKVKTGYYDNYGNPTYKEITEYKEKKVEEEVEEKVEGDPILQRKFIPAPWLDKEAIVVLMKETYSESPIVRADWFLSNICVPPAYYDFLGLGKKLQDFQNLVFTNTELAEKAKSQYKAVVVTSNVARNNRTLTRSPTFTNGYYWESHDSLNSVEDRQYVQNFLNEDFDATEDIGTLPNGLQAYFLTNGDGDRVDFADPNVAVDSSAHDSIVRTGRSCIVCHSSGILPLDDEIRTLTKKLRNSASVKLLVTKKEDAYRVMDLFGSNLDEQIIADQNIYAKAVARVNGLKPEVNAKWFNEFYNDYSEFLLSREDVARELGLAEQDLNKYIKLSFDPLVLGLTRSPQRPVRRDQWERAFQGLMIIIWGRRQGVQVPAPVQPFVLPRNFK